MNTEQSYVGGGNNSLHSEQTVNKSEQTYSAIPQGVIRSSPDLQHSLAVLATLQMDATTLAEVYKCASIAFAVGANQAAASTAEEANNTSISLRLLATRDPSEGKKAVSEFEVVHEALTLYRDKMYEGDPYETGERINFVNQLMVDMTDLLSDLFNRRVQ